MAPRGSVRKGPRGRALSLPGNPELPKRSSIEIMNRLYLRGDPDVVDAIMQLVYEAGYKSGPEAVRHLLYVAIAATPIDGEIRAAMQSVKSQMMQYFGTLFWSKANEMMREFEVDWGKMLTPEYVAREISRLKGELPPMCPTCGAESRGGNTHHD